jgi:hypothetical protein
VALTGDKTESDERDGDDVSTIDGVTKDSTADMEETESMEGLGAVVCRAVWLAKDPEDMVGVLISAVWPEGVERASVADTSVKMVEGVELKMTEEDNPSTLDMISRDAVVGDNVEVSVGKLANGSSNDVSIVAEDDRGLTISLERLDDISVGVMSKDTGTVVDIDITVAARDVSRGVLMSSGTLGVFEVEGRELAIAVGRSSSLVLDCTVTGSSVDET